MCCGLMSKTLVDEYFSSIPRWAFREAALICSVIARSSVGITVLNWLLSWHRAAERAIHLYCSRLGQLLPLGREPFQLRGHGGELAIQLHRGAPGFVGLGLFQLGGEFFLASFQS